MTTEKIKVVTDFRQNNDSNEISDDEYIKSIKTITKVLKRFNRLRDQVLCDLTTIVLTINYEKKQQQQHKDNPTEAAKHTDIIRNYEELKRHIEKYSIILTSDED
jgi:hypothetical protein